MAGATSKTSVKSTVTKKTAKTAAVKSSKTATKSTAAKPAQEKDAAVKQTTKSVPAAAKPKATAAKAVVKPASKSKTASNATSKAASASKSKAAPTVKTAPKSETAKKADVKKTVKPEKTTKPVKADAVKKTSKTAKPVQAEAPVKTTKKAAPVKTTSTKTPKVSKAKPAETVSKQSVAKAAVKKPEAPVVEPELEVKPKAKRATKFMTKGNAAIIAQLRQQLLQRRNEIISSFWGDLGSAYITTQASGDSADAAMDAVHSEMRSQLAEKESQELTDIDYALHKMETGEYGLCEECGMPIPVERLEIKPAADLCVKCQEQLEEDSEYDSYSYFYYD